MVEPSVVEVVGREGRAGEDESGGNHVGTDEHGPWWRAENIQRESK